MNQKPPETPAPEPGIYYDVPAAVYHAWPYASNSRLGDLKRSAEHCREKMLHPEPPTPAKILGDAAHYCILQPELFATRYIVADQCCKPKKDGKRCTNPGKACIGGEWFCGVHLELGTQVLHDPRTILASEEFERCQIMADRVRSHPASAMLFEHRTAVEVSCVWDDPTTGVRCKMRIDMTCDGIETIADIKSTENARPHIFEKSIFKYGYYRQAAFYLNGAKVLGLPSKRFVIVAIEKKGAFGRSACPILPDVIHAGHEEIQRLLPVWGECEKSGIWPGYSDEFNDVGLPAYAWRELEEDAA